MSKSIKLKELGMVSGKAYFIKVAYKETPDGEWSDPTPLLKFATKPTFTNPSRSAITAPLGGTWLTSDSVELTVSYQSLDGLSAKSTLYQVSTSSSFDTILKEGEETTNPFTINGLPADRLLYFRVKSKDSMDNVSLEWSNTVSFYGQERISRIGIENTPPYYALNQDEVLLTCGQFQSTDPEARLEHYEFTLNHQRPDQSASGGYREIKSYRYTNTVPRYTFTNSSIEGMLADDRVLVRVAAVDNKGGRSWWKDPFILEITSGEMTTPHFTAVDTSAKPLVLKGSTYTYGKPLKQSEWRLRDNSTGTEMGTIIVPNSTTLSTVRGNGLNMEIWVRYVSTDGTESEWSSGEYVNYLHFNATERPAPTIVGLENNQTVTEVFKEVVLTAGEEYAGYGEIWVKNVSKSREYTYTVSGSGDFPSLRDLLSNISGDAGNTIQIKARYASFNGDKFSAWTPVIDFTLGEKLITKSKTEAAIRKISFSTEKAPCYSPDVKISPYVSDSGCEWRATEFLIKDFTTGEVLYKKVFDKHEGASYTDDTWRLDYVPTPTEGISRLFYICARYLSENPEQGGVEYGEWATRLVSSTFDSYRMIVLDRDIYSFENDRNFSIETKILPYTDEEINSGSMTAEWSFTAYGSAGNYLTTADYIEPTRSGVIRDRSIRTTVNIESEDLACLKVRLSIRYAGHTNTSVDYLVIFPNYKPLFILGLLKPAIVGPVSKSRNGNAMTGFPTDIDAPGPITLQATEYVNLNNQSDNYGPNSSSSATWEIDRTSSAFLSGNVERIVQDQYEFRNNRAQLTLNNPFSINGTIVDAVYVRMKYDNGSWTPATHLKRKSIDDSLITISPSGGITAIDGSAGHGGAVTFNYSAIAPNTVKEIEFSGWSIEQQKPYYFKESVFATTEYLPNITINIPGGIKRGPGVRGTAKLIFGGDSTVLVRARLRNHAGEVSPWTDACTIKAYNSNSTYKQGRVKPTILSYSNGEPVNDGDVVKKDRIELKLSPPPNSAIQNVTWIVTEEDSTIDRKVVTVFNKKRTSDYDLVLFSYSPKKRPGRVSFKAAYSFAHNERIGQFSDEITLYFTKDEQSEKPNGSVFHIEYPTPSGENVITSSSPEGYHGYVRPYFTARQLVTSDNLISQDARYDVQTSTDNGFKFIVDEYSLFLSHFAYDTKDYHYSTPPRRSGLGTNLYTRIRVVRKDGSLGGWSTPVKHVHIVPGQLSLMAPEPNTIHPQSSAFNFGRWSDYKEGSKPLPTLNYVQWGTRGLGHYNGSSYGAEPVQSSLQSIAGELIVNTDQRFSAISSGSMFTVLTSDNRPNRRVYYPVLLENGRTNNGSKPLAPTFLSPSPNAVFKSNEPIRLALTPYIAQSGRPHKQTKWVIYNEQGAVLKNIVSHVFLTEIVLFAENALAFSSNPKQYFMATATYYDDYNRESYASPAIPFEVHKV